MVRVRTGTIQTSRARVKRERRRQRESAGCIERGPSGERQAKLVMPQGSAPLKRAGAGAGRCRGWMPSGSHTNTTRHRSARGSSDTLPAPCSGARHPAHSPHACACLLAQSLSSPGPLAFALSFKCLLASFFSLRSVICVSMWCV